MKRQKSILRPHHQYKLIGKNRREIEAIPLVRTNKKSVRKISKCPDIGELPTSLLRFGPVYYVDDSSESAKEEAWKQVLEMSPDEDEETLDVYLSAIRRVEKKARATYADEVLDPFTESQFRWIMIKDGCFFLQLVLFIFGASKQLGYPDNHIIFGKKQEKNVVHGWIKSMFYVGNQIPLAVLNELMKQTFFQNVITKHAHGKWERPTDLLSKGVLYDLLILPAAEFASRKTSSTPLKVSATSAYLMKEPASDLLHGLQNLVLGPRVSRNDSDEEEEDEEDEEDSHDLEAGARATLSAAEVGVGNDGKELSVSRFGQKGVYFWKSNGAGIRGIQFKNRMLYAGVYLPTIPVNRDTELLFKNLKYYEICQQQNEVRSYLGLMNQLISTYEDVNHLASKGIIEVSKPQYKERFLRMLRNLSERATNHDHRYVMQQLRDYSSFPWEKFKYVAIIAFILTIAQTVFGVLSYVVAVAQLHQSNP